MQNYDISKTVDLDLINTKMYAATKCKFLINMGKKDFESGTI